MIDMLHEGTLFPNSLRKQLFYSLLASRAKDVSRGGTSASQRQKFHTDDVNQC